ncbi:hypothetical protein ACT4UM_28825, partial [Bacillus sp. SS-TM]
MRVALNYSQNPVSPKARSLILWKRLGDCDRLLFFLSEVAVFQFFKECPCLIGFEHFSVTGSSSFCPEDERARFVEAKHFFKVIGDELKNLRVALN